MKPENITPHGSAEIKERRSKMFFVGIFLAVIYGPNC